MRLINKIFAFAVTVGCMASCGLDNYDPPKYMLTGKIVNITDEKPIQVQGSFQKTPIRIHEYGWKSTGNFSARVAQDGTFSALVFKGTYHLIPALDRGPWARMTADDTLHIEVKGDTEVVIKVKAFALLDEGSFTLNGDQLTGTANIKIYDPSNSIERATLFANWTSFVDNDCKQLGEKNGTPVINGDTGTVSINMVLSEQSMKLANERGLYARIGIKLRNTSDLTYTPVFKLK